MPSFSSRSHAAEMMDDFSIVDERLSKALDNLRGVNRWLGGYRASMQVLSPFFRTHRSQTIRILDLATGVADFPEVLVRWAHRRGLDLEIVGIDANPATVEYTRSVLDQRLPPSLRSSVEVRVADALDLPYEDDRFDVVMTSLFLHHLSDEASVRLLQEMNRVARSGLLVNDLHRHPIAYYAIRTIGAVLPVSPMFAHDGPVSVMRAFRREDLQDLAHAAGLERATIRWHWAFRWTLTTLGPDA